MAEFKPASISKAAYAFCRYTVAVIFWLAIILNMKEFVLAGFIILLLSAILKVRRAPLIVLYTYTINRIFPSENVIVDEKGIRFAHSFGSAVSLICLLMLYFGNSAVGWGLTVFLAVLKTSAAFGFCSALKLYTCMNSGTCCRVGKLVRKLKHD
ncbi:MAG: DUF4395 family protein [Clostridiaceae bacterium]